MRSLRWVYGLTVVAAAATVGWLPSCSDNSCQGADCGVPDSGGAPSISGGGCDSSKPASQGGCAVADSDGFFVSPSGSDAADGSKATPFKTLGKGISAAAAAPTKPNVYVCAGTFAENLTIQNAPQGVALHGGFSCADWSPGGGTTAVAPAYAAGNNPQYVLRVLGTAALVEAMTLTAPDATDPGASSIAAFVDTSPGMTFRRATVTAGKAADGVSPTQVAQLAANTAGNNANMQVAGAEQKCNCTADFTIGGAGGYVGDAGQVSAKPGLPVIAGFPDAGAVTMCQGGDGANGLDQGPSNSTNVLGELTSNGWAPAPGGPGATGGTAQGGAGGNWDPGNGLGGGSGGCGGCGGAGGSGGGGGGASIAVAALNTTLRIQASTLHGGQAGNGGNGALGQLGQPGGGGGQGALQCKGGAGGKGGNGGAGGGGAGGVSLGIAALNTTPDIDTQSSVLGGKAGTGGNDGASPPTSKAIDGVAEAFHTF